MTTEEMEAIIAQHNEKITQLSEATAKIAELEAKVTPQPEDPDAAYKPTSWKELHDNVDSKAEAAALRVLKEAEEKKDEIRKNEEARAQKQNEDIDKALAKLQEEGIIAETTDKNDEGGRQRTQILGMTLRSEGTNIESVARALKTAWDAGMEYDFESNQFKRAGSPVNTARMAPVGSSAARTPAAPAAGSINLQGIRGDLDEAQRRWESQHK